MRLKISDIAQSGATTDPSRTIPMQRKRKFHDSLNFIWTNRTGWSHWVVRFLLTETFLQIVHATAINSSGGNTKLSPCKATLQTRLARAVSVLFKLSLRTQRPNEFIYKSRNFHISANTPGSFAVEHKLLPLPFMGNSCGLTGAVKTFHQWSIKNWHLLVDKPSIRTLPSMLRTALSLRSSMRLRYVTYSLFFWAHWFGLGVSTMSETKRNQHLIIRRAKLVATERINRGSLYILQPRTFLNSTLYNNSNNRQRQPSSEGLTAHQSPLPAIHD